ncbi:PREDICTED: probable receptor-like protein kinase At1g11050-like [Fragaria vesca subsp. vesca]
MGYLLVFVLVLLPLSTSSQSVDSTTANRTTCPMDLSYVLRIPFSSSSCRNFDSQSKVDATQNLCCQTIQSLFGIGLAQYLKATNVFLLPNIATSTSCLQNLQSRLTSLPLPSNLVSYCYTPSHFVTSPSICAGIETSQDWISRLNQTTAFDSDCSADLTSRTSCNACLEAGNKIHTQLMVLDGNTTRSINCFFFTVLYAAAAFDSEPGSDGAMTCIFGLSSTADSLWLQQRKAT